MSESVEIVNNKTVGTTHDHATARNSEFSAIALMARWAGNPDWVEGYKPIEDPDARENDYTELWKTIHVSSEEVINRLYTSIANIADNVANLDLCGVAALRNRIREYGMDGTILSKYKLPFPVEIARMVDLFSVNKAHLMGVVGEDGKREYAPSTAVSKDLWERLVASCSSDDEYRVFIRNTFRNTLTDFVNMTTADGRNVIWKTAPRRYSTELFFSRVEYANPSEPSHGASFDGSSYDGDRNIYERKQRLGVPKFFSEKYYADEVLIGNRTLTEFTDAEQEVIRMEIDRRAKLWEHDGVNGYTYVREAKVLSYIRFVTLMANRLYDVTDYDIDKRKSLLDDVDDARYLIQTDGVPSVDYDMIDVVSDTLADYCINISYLRETVRTEAQRNMLKGTKALLVDAIRETLAKNVYSVYGGNENFWRQTNADNVVGVGVEMPKDLKVDLVEYIDTTRYTNIRAKKEETLDTVNNRYWQVSGTHGDLSNDDILDFYNRLTEYRDPWGIFECANDTDERADPKRNLYQFLNYVYNSGAFSATLEDLVFDTDKVAERIAPVMPEIYGYEEIVALLRGAATSAEVPGRLPRIYFDHDAAAATLLDAFEGIDCGEPQFKPAPSADEWTDEYTAVYNRYHDLETIKSLISSYKTPDTFIANASKIFPSAYFDTKKTYDYLYDKLVYRDDDLSSVQEVLVTDEDGNQTYASSLTRTVVTNEYRQTTFVSGGITRLVTISGNDVSVLPPKPYSALTGDQHPNSFQTAWEALLKNPTYQNPERVSEAFYYAYEYPELQEETFSDPSNFMNADAVDAIEHIGDGFNYEATDIVAAKSTYEGTMVHESGVFGDALYKHIGNVEWGIRPFANSQNTVHPSVQVHAFLSALTEYVASYHAIVRYLDVNHPVFSSYCRTVIDRVDKLGNTIHYWKNSVDDFSGYTTDYERAGSDADANESVEGPFNLDALQALMDDKTGFISGIKNGTNPYYLSESRGVFILNDAEKQSEIDNIVLYYDDICRLAAKEIARYCRDKYGNSYILYKDRGHRADRNALGRLWIRKYNHPLAFPGLALDELSSSLSNASQVRTTDNTSIERKIVEQYAYPQRSYDDINASGCFMGGVDGVPESYSLRCRKVEWDELSEFPGVNVDEIRGSDGYHPVENVRSSYFTFDDDGTVVPSGQETSIWDAGRVNPGYIEEGDPVSGYTDKSIVSDYERGDLSFDMLRYETVNYKTDHVFGYTVTARGGDVAELTFVAYKDDANVTGRSNNYFLDGDDGSRRPITYHDMTIVGIFTIRLPASTDGAPVVKFTVSPDERSCDFAGLVGKFGTSLAGMLSLGGYDTNLVNVEFAGGASGSTTGDVTIGSNGQNVGKYYDFTMNGTLDEILLDAKDPHYDTYDKSWALDATVNQTNGPDGASILEFYKDGQHNVGYVQLPDVVSTDGRTRITSVHCGNVDADNAVHAVFARITETADTDGDGKMLRDARGNIRYSATNQVTFHICSFGGGRYLEKSFSPHIEYAPVHIDGAYYFRTTSDGDNVYVAFCSELPPSDAKVGNYVSGYDGPNAGTTAFGRCSELGYSNGVTIVGFEVSRRGLVDRDDVRYVLRNETLGYYPQYSGLVGRSMTYANPSMAGRDSFGFELMFSNIERSRRDVDYINDIALRKDTSLSSLTMGDVDVVEHGGHFLITYKDGDAEKSMFVDPDGNRSEVAIGDASFFSMIVGDSASNDRALIFGDTLGDGIYDVSTGGDATIALSVDDVDLDEDGNPVRDVEEIGIVDVSNVDANGNFVVLCLNNLVLSCQYDEDARTVHVHEVVEFKMSDRLATVTSTIDGKYVVCPSSLESGMIAFVFASTGSDGYLELGHYSTDFADKSGIGGVAIFRDGVFLLSTSDYADHVFRVGGCFYGSGKFEEGFVLLDGDHTGFLTFAADDDHLFMVPKSTKDTVLVYNPQTRMFDEAYQLGRLVPDIYSGIAAARVCNEELRMLVRRNDDPDTPEDESDTYNELVADIGNDVNYAIIELDKDFPILVTYNELANGTNGVPDDDNIVLNFRCLFESTVEGRRTISLKSWLRETSEITYNKTDEPGTESDSGERYGDENLRLYGDSRRYRITATGGRKFYIERLYQEGNYPMGEFTSSDYLSFTYNLGGLPNLRRNRSFAHFNDKPFTYTVSGPFGDLGYEMGTQFDVEPTDSEIAERFRGLAVSRSFDTYWLSGEIFHLSSVVEPSSVDAHDEDRLVDSNLAFGRNTIICSCESMFDGHRNLVCANRELDINSEDNSRHIFSTRNMFRGDVSLELPVVSIDESNILDTASMFEGCGKAVLAGAAFPQRLTSVERMFSDCGSATLGWDMVMPGSVVSSLSAVFRNCVSGTFSNFEFDAFPMFRMVPDGAFNEIVTLADIYEDDPESDTYSNDNRRNLSGYREPLPTTRNWWEVVTEPNPEAGRFVETGGDHPDSQSEVDTERFLSFDQDEADGTPLLNFIGSNYDDMPLAADWSKPGRLTHDVRNELVGDFMFYNTPKFKTDDISFQNVASVLCSTVSMFEKCGTIPDDMDAERDGKTGEWRVPNAEAGRLMRTSTDSDSPDTMDDLDTEMFLSFDVGDDEPLLNFERPYKPYEYGTGAFDGTIDMPMLVDARRMFRDSAAKFVDTTIKIGRGIRDVSEMFRNCRCISDVGPRLQTYAFRGAVLSGDNGVVTNCAPVDARALYAGCDRMTTVDVELLGDIAVDGIDDISQACIFRHDYMFAGCGKLLNVIGRINPYVKSAVGMFAGCSQLSWTVARNFIRTLADRGVTCDITGMFYGCTSIGNALSWNGSIITNRLGGDTVVHGDPFDPPPGVTNGGEFTGEIS